MARPDVLAPPADSNPRFDPLTNPGQFLTQFEAQGDPVGSWFADQRDTVLGVATGTTFPSAGGVSSIGIADYEITNFGGLLITAVGVGIQVTIARQNFTLWGQFDPLADSPVIQHTE